jgi:lysophospholipase L1-like esterase
MTKFKKIFVTVYVNILIFLCFIILIELIFGHWFKRNNFGIHMRAERNKIIKINVNHHFGDKIEFIYKRNFYGFIGEEFNPKDVKIIFEGGSTGAETWKPEKNSIVGVLNKLLIKNSINKKIYNSSINGKSIRGYSYDFKYWFKKIPDFKPEYVIFYLGINDRFFPDDEIHRFMDEQHSTLLIKKIRDYIKNNSFILEKIKKIKNEYFKKNYFLYDMDKKDLYDNFEYINYSKAKILHSQNLNEDEMIYINLLNKRLNNLNKVIFNSNFTPIFITQIKFDGLAEKRMYLVNEEIKKFVKKNKYKIIPLDELIEEMSVGDFFDEVHTTISGSKKIANVIYKNLQW